MKLIHEAQLGDIEHGLQTAITAGVKAALSSYLEDHSLLDLDNNIEDFAYAVYELTTVRLELRIDAKLEAP